VLLEGLASNHLNHEDREALRNGRSAVVFDEQGTFSIPVKEL
jgi:hypothetical protein